MDQSEERYWKIGELAAEAGITVRALRHYDRIGLLVPSERSEGGHRLYSHHDVSQLYRIVALRSLDFGLADISSALESQPEALPALIQSQLQRVESDLALQARLRSRLQHLADVLDENATPTANQLLEALEAIMTVRLDRIYTRTGDSGETDLADGKRVAKTDPVLGAADLEEISAHLAAALESGRLAAADTESVRRIQNDLLDVGADIGRPLVEGTNDPGPRITADYVEWLEEACDNANAELEPLTSFLIPGGSAPAPELHLARIVCRRIERLVLEMPDVNPEVVRYLNRLSDLLFILARRVSEADEQVWQPGAHIPGKGG